MKKSFFYVALLLIGNAFVTTSCGDDNDDVFINEGENQTSADLDYSSENAASWHNYMRNVAALLKKDATTLYTAWNNSYVDGISYAEGFKNQQLSDYPTAKSCVEQIIDGCVTIATEVGTAKIGDPYNLYVSGKTTEALYAVESWYSWHSRDDYRNNIYSIRNAYYGSLDGSVTEASISGLVATKNAELDQKVNDAIKKAAEAIYNIEQPFRNHINSTETLEAMTACAELVLVLEDELKPYVINNLSNDVLDPVVDNYVDNVVLPTYLSLKQGNDALYESILDLIENPSDRAFVVACDAWMEARKPWEESEAFLFGPVDALGLDPNMDSWPLDQDAIVQILTSGNYDDLNWSDGDADDVVEAAQSVRGFHTLEYLLFKDGKPRTVK
ncbi:MAG: peptidase M75 [Bacteroidaceae bacterium]|nr:peptidase M75 [Bacteroidaceae bacterium]